MATNEQDREVNIPSTVMAVVAEFRERAKVDAAVEALTSAGFRTEQISFVARGAEHLGEKFIPGTLMLTVHPEGREDAAMRILRAQGASNVTSGQVTATGEVLSGEEAAKEREETTSG